VSAVVAVVWVVVVLAVVSLGVAETAASRRVASSLIAAQVRRQAQRGTISSTSLPVCFDQPDDKESEGLLSSPLINIVDQLIWQDQMLPCFLWRARYVDHASHLGQIAASDSTAASKCSRSLKTAKPPGRNRTQPLPPINADQIFMLASVLRADFRSMVVGG
jgi:hypothetical protein